MSNTNGVAYRDKSMNGVITLSDGGGTTISNGIISANTLQITELTTNTIKSTTPSSTVNAYIANTGNINLGGATSTLKLSNTIEPFSTSSPVSLFTANTASITLGNHTNTNTVGKYDLVGDDIVGFGTGDTTRLFNNLNEGELLIAPALTTGTCSIGSATSINTVGKVNFIGDAITSNDVNSASTLMSNITTGSLTIAPALTTGSCTIGNATNTNKVGNFNLIGNAITSSSATTAVSLMSNLTSGALNIATGHTNFGTITLGNSANSNRISNFIYQGNALTALFAGGIYDFFGNTTSGQVRFCGGMSSGSATFGSNLFATGFISFGSTLGQIRFFRPFFLMYTSLLTPLSNQVGYTFPSTSNTTTLPASTITTVNTLTNIPVGIWIITANVTFPIITGTDKEINITISQTAGLDINCGSSGVYCPHTTSTLNVSRIIVNTAVQTYLLNATQYSPATQTVSGVVFTATRIS